MRVKAITSGHRRLARAYAAVLRPKVRAVFGGALGTSAKLVKVTSEREFLAGQVIGVITGELQSSIKVGELSNDATWIDVGSTVVQAGPLHFGWFAKHIAPRPFLFPAAVRAAPRFPGIWEDAYLTHLDRHAR